MAPRSTGSNIKTQHKNLNSSLRIPKSTNRSRRVAMDKLKNIPIGAKRRNMNPDRKKKMAMDRLKSKASSNTAVKLFNTALSPKPHTRDRSPLTKRQRSPNANTYSRPKLRIPKKAPETEVCDFANISCITIDYSLYIHYDGT